jgi:2-polyprenyl-3-methyl-5-hydroxy-6-metoxy-1,4-benzoquinol methylase
MPFLVRIQSILLPLNDKKTMMVLSPITHEPANLIKKIPTDIIINSYKEEVDIDIAGYFKGMDEISVYQCAQTGYRFYYPFTLAGDDKLYEDLQKFEWYYSEWKWDYVVADSVVERGQKVLDIGCGYGRFLQHLKETKDCDCTGLEFNDIAVRVANERGVSINKEFIQDHAKTNEGKYEVVSFFHLLEHITDIDSFVAAAIKCLKPGGTLIICVPNNNPYCYRFQEFHSLNMPPHHMGLWNEESLCALDKIYPITVDKVFKETLQRYRHYTKLYIKDKAGDNSLKHALLSAFKIPLTGLFLLNRKQIQVGSILVSYKKKS